LSILVLKIKTVSDFAEKYPQKKRKKKKEQIKIKKKGSESQYN
jgi:Na+-transporting methylmalonyl-CoA/oxaloacetate decarboxylase gamma subunit